MFFPKLKKKWLGFWQLTLEPHNINHIFKIHSYWEKNTVTKTCTDKLKPYYHWLYGQNRGIFFNACKHN